MTRDDTKELSPWATAAAAPSSPPRRRPCTRIPSASTTIAAPFPTTVRSAAAALVLSASMVAATSAATMTAGTPATAAFLPRHPTVFERPRSFQRIRGEVDRPNPLTLAGSSDIADDYAKWDNLSDDDDDDEAEEAYEKKKDVPADMVYNVRNIGRQAANYDALRSAGGRDVVADVYLRSPDDETAWLVGRVACVSDVPVPLAVDRQYPLIERHGWLLRPVDLHPRRGPFEVWYTEAGESDEAALEGDPEVRFVRVREEDVLANAGDGSSGGRVNAALVGFKAVSYDDGAEPLGVRLTDQGRIVVPGGMMATPGEEEALSVLDTDAEDVLEKIRSTASLEDLLDDSDFQDLMDRM